MNYFAHARLVLSVDRPLVTAGSILPDLIRYAGARRSHGQPRWDGPGEGLQQRAALGDLAEGIRCHLEADAVFHTSRAFVGVMQRLMVFVREAIPILADHWTRWLLPHLAVEVVLDRLLVRADPAGAEWCYEVMRRLHDSEVLPAVCRGYDVEVIVTRALLHQWVRNRRLHSYDTLDGLTLAVERALGRWGRPVFAPRERDAFAALVAQVETLIADPYALLPARNGRRR